MFTSAVFSLPQQVIDEVLADGGNDRDSRFVIAARMKKDFPLEENAAFFRRHYETGGKGFLLEGKQVSAWWDAGGIRIAYGNTAQSENAILISWEQAARRVRELLDDGRYLSQPELDMVDHMERRALSERLWYLYRDDIGALPQEWISNQGFPDDTIRIAEILSDPASRDSTIAQLKADFAAMSAEKGTQRRWHNGQRLIDDLSALQRTPLEFTAPDVRDTLRQGNFITQDEIDAVLKSGGITEGGKSRIYRFFQVPHTLKEQADFLRNEYGIGGRSHALSGADNSNEAHDSKGITFSRGNLSVPYAKVTLNWTQAAKRIGELIGQGLFLSAREIETLQQTVEPIEPIVLKDYGNSSDVPEVIENEVIENEAIESETLEAVADSENLIQPVETKQPVPPSLGADDLPEVISAMAEYNRQKETHPEHIVLIRVNDHYETYGDDAKRAAPLLDSRLLVRSVSGSGEIEMTGFSPADVWPDSLMKLWKKGNSVLLMEPGENDAYEVVKERAGADYIPNGARIQMDGHEFEVDSVDYDFGRVSLKDLMMFASGIPIFRDEEITLVHEVIEEQAETPTPGFVPNGTNPEPVDFVPNGTNPEPIDFVSNGLRSVTISLAPNRADEMPAPVGNYRITDDHLGEGGQRAKADRNLRAIRTLRQIEQEIRAANQSEQEILSQYVGWGGISQIFDESNAEWQERRDELTSLLDPAEFAAARASTLNAHYTSPTVIRAIYQGLNNLGFHQGSILEPACGIGNFFGVLPESMQDSKLYGIELDSITGRIAQKLYPDARISIQGFEHAALPDGFFDVAVGNVPFGAYTLPDSRYDRHHFRIHDYFFAKSLDKVRAGGVVAFVTSKGTMDKQDSSVRRYIAQRAELLGAIRLPNTAFKANAGTEVTSDILFLQKRDRSIDIEPEWVQVEKNEDGIPINQYFLDHPDMILGTMAFDRSMYGSEQETTCNPIPGAHLVKQLESAIAGVQGRYEELSIDDPSPDESRIPADPTVSNFSFVVRDGRVYFRRDHLMERCDLSATDDRRVRGMIALRDLTRELIQVQLEGVSDETLQSLQDELNKRYDSFTGQFGLLSDRRNAAVFREDDGYYLLTSLEVLDDEHKLERKSDIFSKRTIAQNQVINHVDTAPEALAVSMAERAAVDLDFMSELTGMDKDKLIADLHGLIFQDPVGKPGPYEKWQTADEYLSGDVRQKLRVAESAVAVLGDQYAPNVESLKAVQPKDLEPQEIDVRLGATWIPPSDITDFMHELLKTPFYMRWKIKTVYVAATGVWNVQNKGLDGNNAFANTQYGTDYRSGYKIIEESLNLRDVRVFDTVQDEYGNEKRVLNQKQTILAQQKQTAIREAFKDWIWKSPERRERLCRIYNDTYNCIRPREYDGSHLRFSGMNPELRLRPHQKNAVARVLYGGNTLLAHTVGAGKTAVMVASLMEKIRIGLAHKALIAVPNHLTEQTAAEFLRFFPAAKVLVATRRDFEKQNRKRFMGRIATGDYDAIVMGHSQFEKIPVSKERQIQMLEAQIAEIMSGIEEIKSSRGERFTIKELERTRKSLEARLKKLNSDENKDAVVTFEQLGVDMLYVDEAHGFKNLAVITKMRNVAGISTTEAKKSSDMYMKCRYLSELTGDRGVVFATGTPISNSMTELYTMQRYLQSTELGKRGLSHFDSWASNFGETQTAIELAPEGTGYRLKTRFSKFFNLPELMSMFKQAADIQTPDMLNLPVPRLKGGQTRNIRTAASEYQKTMVAELGERADTVRKGGIDPHEDNMLKITNDGRLLALDARLIDPTLPDDPGSKVNACVREVLRIHEEGKEERLTQLIFCDLSIPKAEKTDGTFDDVYHDIKRKLIQAGVPEQEIAFIHDANTEAQKDELFAKVRKGAVRILIGSTPKMGAGTNVRATRSQLKRLRSSQNFTRLKGA